MKVNYYGYCLRNISTGNKFRFDIRPFIAAFCRFDSVTFKNRFLHQGEHVYLLHHIDDVYLFLITRSDEIIRKVNTADLSIGEIHSALAQNEQLGFASYLILKQDHFGFGSTLLAPKADALVKYINNLLETIGILDWQLLPQAVLYQATRDEALTMDFVGKATIGLEKTNTFAQAFLSTFTADTDDTLELDSIEIVIKPKARKNIKPLVSKVLNSIPDEGVEKMVLKAKEDAASNLVDLYLAGKGIISDQINNANQFRIHELMQQKLQSNVYLQGKLNEYRNNGDFEEPEALAIPLVRFHSADAWSTMLPDL